MKVTIRSYNTFYFFLLCCFMLAGCATVKPSALNQNLQSVDISKESIVILSVKVSNQYKPSYQPKIAYVFVWETDKENGKKFSFKVDGEYREIKNECNEYLISFQLPPGRYKLRELFAQSGIFPIIGTFSIPIYSVFEIGANEIIYLGHIEAYLVERTNDSDLRAGPVIPLIDQAVAGASGGTFVIKISDLYEDDMGLFRKQYPCLSNCNIKDMALPSWEKPSEADMQ